MEIFLTHDSARHFYETCTEIGRPSLVLPGPDCVRSPQEARALGFDIPDDPDPCFAPLEVLVDSKEHRTAFDTIQCHTLAAQGHGEAMRYFGKGIYVVSPALSFIQYASAHSVVETIQYGSMLCGGFRLLEEDHKSTEERPVLITLEELTQEVNSWKNMAGIKTAMRALPWVNENCASPAEIKMCMRFDLPYRLGGYGIEKPCSNLEIELSKSEQKISRLTRCYGDAVWPEHNLIVEYDSNECHTGALKLESDALRRNTLRHAGYTVLEVTNKQLSSIEAFEQVVDEVARITGKRIKASDRGKTTARSDLMHALFPWKGYF